LELFAISISYLLLIAVAANIKNWKLDFVSVAIIFFCFYSVLRIFWGSKFRTVFQIILPFAVFFSIRLFIKDQNQDQISFLLSIIVIAYLIPLFGSFYQIFQGTSNRIMVETLTGIERHSGLFEGIRPLANAMFFFSVFFYLKYILFRPEGRYIRYALILMLLISVYCAFKTYSRSIYIGLFIFWAFALLGLNKKHFFIFLFLSIFFGALYQANLQQIFYKTEEFDVKTASSGRSFVWEHNISLFINSYSFDEKFLGRGLGVVTPDGSVGKEWEIWSSHNDYLHLLMQLGGIGMFLYLLIHVAILREVIYGNIEKKIKYFYIGYCDTMPFFIIYINSKQYEMGFFFHAKRWKEVVLNYKEKIKKIIQLKTPNIPSSRKAIVFITKILL